MLGSIIDKLRWQWTIWGKHPSASDYLNWGLKTRVELALSNWIQKGYSQLSVEESDARKPCTWRFWTQATGNHALACGVITNSCDRLGRPYPLLVMGTGKLKGWERYWEYLSVGLELTWRRMEELTASRAEKFSELERALGKFQPPVVDWSDIKLKRSILTNTTITSLPETERLRRSDFKQADRLTIESDQIVPLRGDPIEAAMMQWQRRAEDQNQCPNALFMGGPVEKPYLAVFNRPLSPSDFVRLWTLGKTE